LPSVAKGLKSLEARSKCAAALIIVVVTFHSGSAYARGLSLAVDQISDTLACIVAFDGGTVGLDASRVRMAGDSIRQLDVVF